MEVRTFIKENIAPEGAKYIGVYDNEGKFLGKIKTGPLSVERDRKLYSFGIVSDTHYNDGDEKDVFRSGDDFNEDMINALRFFTNRTDAEFICCSGDLTSDRMAHAEHFREIKEATSPIPFYTCIGNHDNKAIYNGSNNEEWGNNTYRSDHPYHGTTVFACGSDNSQYDPTFYFVKELPSGRKDVFIFLSLDYVRNSANSSGETYYMDSTLDWFESVLEKFKNERCFVFTHLFFKEKAGNANHVYTDNREPTYWLSGKQHDRLDEINRKYGNTVWFTGHSHFHWESQAVDPKANVFADNGQAGYNVHIPSLSRPLNVNTNGYDYNGSQGGLVNVYEDYIEIRGINFQLRRQTPEEFAKLDFSNVEYLKASDFDPDESRFTIGTAEQNADGSVTLWLNEKSGFHVTCGTFDKNANSKGMFNLKVEHVQILDGDGNDITGIDTIGFMDDTTDPYKYAIRDNANISYLTGTGCDFRASGNYKGTYPVMVNLKAKLLVTPPSYENKYLPIAEYRINVGHG